MPVCTIPTRVYLWVYFRVYPPWVYLWVYNSVYLSGCVTVFTLSSSLPETGGERERNPLQREAAHKEREDYQHPFHCWW